MKPYAGKVPSVARQTFDPFPWYSCEGFDEFGAPVNVMWHAKHDHAVRRATRLARLAAIRSGVVR